MARWISASADPRSSSPGACGWDPKRGPHMGLRSVAKVMVGKTRCWMMLDELNHGGRSLKKRGGTNSMNSIEHGFCRVLWWGLG